LTGAPVRGQPAPSRSSSLQHGLDALRELDPVAAPTERDLDVGEISMSLDQYYKSLPRGETEFPRGLDGALRTIFDDVGGSAEGSVRGAARPAAALIKKSERDLVANVYRWTGHFPERTRGLLRHLGERAAALGLAYAAEREGSVAVALTTLVTALAMNWVHGGSYGPESPAIPPARTETRVAVTIPRPPAPEPPQSPAPLASPAPPAPPAPHPAPPPASDPPRIPAPSTVPGLRES
jgi:hypothetical protein